MSVSSITPIDGRYAKSVQSLATIFSEYGLIQRRILVEVEWLLTLYHNKVPGFPELSPRTQEILRQFPKNFTEQDAEKVKEIEKKTNHDVKAIEYFLGQFLKESEVEEKLTPFIHFGLTSEDVNNLSHALQLRDGRQILRKSICDLEEKLDMLRVKWVDVPMASRTHGQLATPTTVGKEFAVFQTRLDKAWDAMLDVKLCGKLNGAAGTHAAFMAAYPKLNPVVLSSDLVEGRLHFSCQKLTTQIEPHDYMAELFDAIARANTILTGFCRDIWGYVSLGYFKQKLKDGEVGSSTMPHKVNPIDFENAEGNFGLANAILRHMAEKLPISRFQRDLTDSTVLRNMGVAFGYTLIAYTSILKGLDKIEIDEVAIKADLDDAWELLAEPIQTVARRYGDENAYEKLKNATRGNKMTQEGMQKLIESLDIPDDAKGRLLALTPSTYVGLAPRLARMEL